MILRHKRNGETRAIDFPSRSTKQVRKEIMKDPSFTLSRTATWLCASVLAVSTTAFAQQSQPAAPPDASQQSAAPDNGGGWPSVSQSDGQPAQAAPNNAPPNNDVQ